MLTARLACTVDWADVAAADRCAGDRRVARSGDMADPRVRRSHGNNGGRFSSTQLAAGLDGGGWRIRGGYLFRGVRGPEGASGGKRADGPVSQREDGVRKLCLPGS